MSVTFTTNGPAAADPMFVTDAELHVVLGRLEYEVAVVPGRHRRAEVPR